MLNTKQSLVENIVTLAHHVRYITSSGLVALTCIVHDIDVGSQLRAGKVVAVLHWVIESRQQYE